MVTESAKLYKTNQGEIMQMDCEELWELMIRHQGETFYTVKGLPFHYEIRGGELFVDRRGKSITRATVLKAYSSVQADPQGITGPKALNVFGAPYIWAILKKFGIWGNAPK